MTVNLELYRAFLTVAEEGSFTLAARELGLTQSAISQAIRQLEGLLETQLFLRTSRGAVLTDSGKVLMDHVGGLLSSVNRAQEYFAQLRGLSVGSLRIGASDTLCRHVLLEPLKTFHHEHPGITVQVTNRTSGETAQLLRRGSVDMGLVNLPMDGLSDFEVYEIMALHDCFVCSDQYRPELRGPLSLIDLRAHPLLMLERQSASRRYLDAWLRQKGLDLTPQMELGSLELLMDFAQSGLGLAAVVREFAGHRLGQGLREITLEEGPPARSVGILLRRGMPPSAAAKALIDMLHDVPKQ